MASIAISASLHGACGSHHVSRKQQPQAKRAYSLGSKQVTKAVTIDVEGQKGLKIDEKINESMDPEDKLKDNFETESSVPKFWDERWKNGTWDLNMFVRNGRMDWDKMIVAEARRRKFLEMYPEATTNQEPVQFRSSVIPWCTWLMRTYLPEAELLNASQTGNFICKTGLFITVIGVTLFRNTQDFNNLRMLADEATYYDEQWQASWKDQNQSSASSEKTRNT